MIFPQLRSKYLVIILATVIGILVLNQNSNSQPLENDDASALITDQPGKKIKEEASHFGVSFFMLFHQHDDFNITIGDSYAFSVAEPTLGLQFSFYKQYKKVNLISNIGIKQFSKVTAFSVPGASQRADLKIHHILSDELMPVIFMSVTPEIKIYQTELFKLNIAAGPLAHFNLIDWGNQLYFLTLTSSPAIDAFQQYGFKNPVDFGLSTQLNLYFTLYSKYDMNVYCDYGFSLDSRDMFINYIIYRNQEIIGQGNSTSTFNSLRFGIMLYL